MMESVRKGLRAGEIEKDTYGRLVCAACEVQLAKADDPDDVGSIRTCPECGVRWRRL